MTAATGTMTAICLLQNSHWVQGIEVLRHEYSGFFSFPYIFLFFRKKTFSLKCSSLQLRLRAELIAWVPSLLNGAISVTVKLNMVK